MEAPRSPADTQAPRAPRLAAPPPDPRPARSTLPVGRPQQAEHHLDQRALAGAVMADQPDALAARCSAQIDLAHRDLPPIRGRLTPPHARRSRRSSRRQPRPAPADAAAHQRRAVDHAARMDRRKLRLRPAHHLHRRAVQQQLGRRRTPDHLVDQVVRPVGRVGDAVAVQVERRIVAPVVAAAAGPTSPAMRVPTYITWYPVADEGIAR